MSSASHPYKITVLASGSGTNAANLIEYFQSSDVANVVAVLTDNPNAGVLQKAEKLGVPTRILTKEEFRDGKKLKEILQGFNTSMVVLAGYLKKIPDEVVNYYRGIILNIHPSLLPKYGGKGMYGHKVHEAVLAAGDKESGITIHLVDEVYDNGEILFQEKLAIEKGWKVEDIEREIHRLEHKYFPIVVEKTIIRLKKFGF